MIEPHHPTAPPPTYEPPAVEPLRLVFVDDEIVVDPAAGLDFGREADLVIDDNPYLHRRLGAFQARRGVWWLLNTGSAISMELSDRATPSKLSVGPGGATPVPFHRSLLRFQAGSASYELEVITPTGIDDLGGPLDPRASDGSDLIPESTPTRTTKAVPLNDEQRLLLVALAERRLRDRSAPVSDLPTNREVAAGLGWSTTKFNRKLDNLCEKFGRLGVAGLKGDVAGLAKGRRERLVDHVLTVGLIGEGDLPLLQLPEGGQQP